MGASLKQWARITIRHQLHESTGRKDEMRRILHLASLYTSEVSVNICKLSTNCVSFKKKFLFVRFLKRSLTSISAKPDTFEKVALVCSYSIGHKAPVLCYKETNKTVTDQ